MAQSLRELYISKTGIEYEFEFDQENQIVIWVNQNKDGGTWHEFPVNDSGEIDWEAHQEDWALIPDDVIEVANKFASKMV